MWLPDTRDPAFRESCRREALAIAKVDKAGEEVMDFIEAVYEWPV
jgi:hypothetical protein